MRCGKSRRALISGLMLSLAAASQSDSAVVIDNTLLGTPRIPVVPMMSGSKVLFQDYLEGAYRLYVVDVNTKAVSEVRNNAATYMDPLSFGGTHVAWIGYTGGSGTGGTGGTGGGGVSGPLSGISGGGAEYFVKRLTVSTKSEATVTTNTAYKEDLSIDGSSVVWSDYRYFLPGDTTIEIFLYQSSESRITTHSGYKAMPHIRGKQIVWQDYRSATSNKMNADIYAYDLDTKKETAICVQGAYQAQPCVYQNLIVWQDFRNAGTSGKNADIYLYDMTSKVEKPICTNSAYQATPKIYGNTIVWHDYRNTSSDSTNADIYMYDLITSKEYPVTTKAGFQSEPALYGDVIVWYDFPDGKLYMGRIGRTTGVHVEVSAIDVTHRGVHLSVNKPIRPSVEWYSLVGRRGGVVRSASYAPSLVRE